MKILDGVRVVNLAVNLPGPAAASRLGRMGAEVVKVEPPTGDPMEVYFPDWYRDMCSGHTVYRLDLKSGEGKTELFSLLEGADALLSASRPSAMARLGLDPETLHERFPALCQVMIVGYASPRENEPGHDLTYQASMGLLYPPHMPRSLLSDIAGAERAVTELLGLLLYRQRTGKGAHVFVPLAEAVSAFADPVRYGSTLPGASLGGALPEYNLYRTADGGWVAVAALEPHFKKKLESLLQVSCLEGYRAVFASQDTSFWQTWAEGHDLPIEPVR